MLLPLKSLLITTTLSILLSATAISFASEGNKNKLPEIGAAGFSVLSLDKERLIGQALMQQLRATKPIIDDPILTEYINDLGNQLVKNAQDVNYSFEFFLINNKEINAFAFFGGHVGIHSGLITLADTESELASVIAHEISHVTQRHLARHLESRSKSQSLTTAGMISGILLSLVNPTVGMAALSASMAASQQASINYTRSNEKEADRVGIALLANSHFNPKGAADFFNKLAEKYRYSTKPPAMLLTHPLPESRISDVRQRAQNYPPLTLAPKLNFELAKARITARYQNTPEENIRYYQNILTKKKYRIRAAAEYGLALSYFENHQYQQAKTLLENLFDNQQPNLFYADVLSDIYIQLKQYDTGITMLAELNLLMPNNPVVTLNYANVLETAKKHEQAATLLQDFLLIAPDSIIAYQLLTTIYQKQGKTALMHTAKAEVLAMIGAYPQAIDELQTAYNFAKKQPLVQKRIKAKILQFQAKKDKIERL